MTASDAVAELVAANEAFYTAVERGDLDALTDVWLSGADADDSGGVLCVHPGWPVLRGRATVLRSYALILANTEYIQFFLTDVTVDLLGADVAVVSCTENILTSEDGSESPAPLIGGKAVATNLFRRTATGWRLASHHASPVMTEE